jgi:hypothetical protein
MDLPGKRQAGSLPHGILEIAANTLSLSGLLMIEERLRPDSPTSFAPHSD